eukprot:s886_g22.t1
MGLSFDPTFAAACFDLMKEGRCFILSTAHPKSSGIRKQVKRLREAVDSALKEYLGAESEAHAVQIEASWANVNPACGLPSAPMAALPAEARATGCAREVRDALDFGIDWTLSLWPGTVPPNSAPRQRMTISFNAGVKEINL